MTSADVPQRTNRESRAVDVPARSRLADRTMLPRHPAHDDSTAEPSSELRNGDQPEDAPGWQKNLQCHTSSATLTQVIQQFFPFVADSIRRISAIHSSARPGAEDSARGGISHQRR